MDNIFITEESLFNIKLPEGIMIRRFIETDFSSLQMLYKRDGWMTFITREVDRLKSWKEGWEEYFR